MQNVVEQNRGKVLIATADAPYATVLSNLLKSVGYDEERCHDAKGVLRLITRKNFGVLILDLEICQSSHPDLISFVLRQSPNTQIVLVFEMDQVERAIEGILHGAYFYLPKSADPTDMAFIVGKAFETLHTLEAVGRYEQNVFEEMLGDTPAMKRVVELVTKVAPTDSTVLLLGESGTGKDLLANTIHRLSPRKDKPFVAINCAALPEQLLESELFGHVAGAFTGAQSDKTGLFREADGGTIFLDEIGAMPLLAQARLLRVLQNGEIRRVGEAQAGHVEVRVLAATNRDLVEAVAQKEFREDLYFRLNVIQIVIPPLRERPTAIKVLVKEFVRRFTQKYGKTIRHVEENAAVLLQNYTYPGNVRELESIIAHAVILADGNAITVNDLPDQLRFGDGAHLALPNYASDDIPTLDELERDLIARALEKYGGNQTEAAKKLGISRSTLWRKMKTYSMIRPTDSASKT